jgi:HSP20 family molecular chaperone IbpA
MYSVYASQEPYTTTIVYKSFPEHQTAIKETAHHVLHTLHKAGHYFHEFINPVIEGEEDMHTPRADIRETADKYYIEVELPGIKMNKDFKLQWTNSRSLLLQAHVKQPEIDLQSTAKEMTNGSEEQLTKSRYPIHYFKRERVFGQFYRAFEFWAPVDHDTIEAKLHNGLLRIVITKVFEEQVKCKPVKVEHKVSAPGAF